MPKNKKSNSLEVDFEETIVQVNAKLKEAAEIINQAAKIAEKAGLPVLVASAYALEDNDLSEKLIDVLDSINTAPLERAMSDAGWSMSSAYC